MKKIVLPCLFLSACSTTSGQQFSIELANQIHLGADKSAVQNVLGPPLSQTVTNNDESWAYAYSKTTSTPTAAAFIPGIGGFVGGANTSSAAKQVQVMFHNGKVTRCVVTVSNNNSSVEGMAMSLSQGQSKTVETDCDKS